MGSYGDRLVKGTMGDRRKSGRTLSVSLLRLEEVDKMFGLSSKSEGLIASCHDRLAN